MIRPMTYAHLPVHPAVRKTLFALLVAIAFQASAQTVPSTIVYSYSYDNNDNVTQITDALGRVTQIGYDPLNRRSTLTDPKQGVTQYGYDALDHLISVTDPRSLVTAYTIDGLNNLNQLQSPDTGVTVNTYDAAGNLLTRTDNKQQTTHYAYDVLNRLTGIIYADSSTVSYTYDQGANGVGRLTRISDASGSIAFSYDVGGRLTSETRTINVVATFNGTLTPTPYVTGYSYDSFGRLAAITYPSGRIISYTRDGMGRINQISSTRNNVTTVLVSQVQYQPFGGVQRYINSAGNPVTRSYDQSGRITGYTLNGQQHTLAYDGASNIVAHSDGSNAANNTNYGYDALDRLTSALTSATSLGYAYDPNGNRTSQTNGSASSSNTISASSNQLTMINGGQTMPIVTDANGSITNNGFNQFVYDARGRMSGAVTANGNVQYTINALGQRVQKVNTSGGTVFEYDSSGKLIGEITNQGGVATGKDYVYLGDIPVAVIQM